MKQYETQGPSLFFPSCDGPGAPISESCGGGWQYDWAKGLEIWTTGQEPVVVSLLLVVRPRAPSSFLLLVAMPRAPSSALAPRGPKVLPCQHPLRRLATERQL